MVVWGCGREKSTKNVERKAQVRHHKHNGWLGEEAEASWSLFRPPRARRVRQPDGSQACGHARQLASIAPCAPRKCGLTKGGHTSCPLKEWGGRGGEVTHTPTHT